MKQHKHNNSDDHDGANNNDCCNGEDGNNVCCLLLTRDDPKFCQLLGNPTNINRNSRSSRSCRPATTSTDAAPTATHATSTLPTLPSTSFRDLACTLPFAVWFQLERSIFNSELIPISRIIRRSPSSSSSKLSQFEEDRNEAEIRAANRQEEKVDAVKKEETSQLARLML